MSSAPLQSPNAKQTPDDHFLESTVTLERWPELREALEPLTGHSSDAPEGALLKLFRATDRNAARLQTWHQWCSGLAAVCGTVALLLGVAGVVAQGLGMKEPAIDEFEAALAFATVALVIWGTALKFQRSWLLDRHKAERCRFLKFELLGDPTFWGAAERRDARRRELLTEIETIRALDADGMEDWAASPWMQHSEVEGSTEISTPRLRALAEYYCERRLTDQIDYFERKSARNERADTVIRILPYIFFFGGVVSALVRGAVSLADWDSKTVNAFLLAGTLGFPVIGAGIRTWRAANEFARNTLRFRAAMASLKIERQRLLANIGNGVVFDIVADSEEMLKAEHREWLRLMIEAEWFG